MPTLFPVSIDIAILLLFLLVNLIAGFRYRNTSKTFRGYAVGDKSFSISVLAITIVATELSGSGIILHLERTYSMGLHHVIPVLFGIALSLLITGDIMAPRMGKFLKCTSLPDALGHIYGKSVQVIAGVSSVLQIIGKTAMQFKVVDTVLAYSFDYDGPELTIITATLLILYSASGGIKAVTLTDVIQFLTFGIIFPVLALNIWHQMEDTSQVSYMLNTHPNFSLSELASWGSHSWGMMLSLSYFFSYSLSPQLFQRIVMARNVTQVKYAMKYAILLYIGVLLYATWIGVLVLADSPDLVSEDIMNHIINACTYPGLKGLLGVGILALSMSTADSALNTSAVLIANDIVAPIFGVKKERLLLVAKSSTLILGSVSLLVALNSIQGFLYVFHLSASLYAPIVVAPMILAIFGFQTNRKVVLAAMLSGLATVIFALFCFNSVTSFFPGMVVNAVVMLGGHYLSGIKEGWGHNPIPRAPKAAWFQYQGLKRYRQILNRIQWNDYLSYLLPKQELSYLLFGIYTLTVSCISLYLLPQEFVHDHSIIRVAQYALPIVGSFFAAHSMWPQPLRQPRILMWIWVLSIFFTFFFLGGFTVITTRLSAPQVFLFMLNAIVATLLLRGTIAISMTVLGFLLAGFVHMYSTGHTVLPDDVGNFYFYIGCILTAMGGAVVGNSFMNTIYKYINLETVNTRLNTIHKNTRQALSRSQQYEQRFFAAMSIEGQEVLAAIDAKVKRFYEQAKREQVFSQLSTTQKTLSEVQQGLQDAIEYLNNVVYRVQDHIRLEVQDVVLQTLLSRVLATVSNTNSKVPFSMRVKDQLLKKTIQCDVRRIQQLLVNGLLYAKEHTTQGHTILLNVQPTKLSYSVGSITGHTKYTEALCITITTEEHMPTIQNAYQGNVNSASKQLQLDSTAIEIELADNIRIVNAHYGASHTHETANSHTQVYVIPQHLREVRPKMMDMPEMEVGSTLKALEEVHPEEIALLNRIAKETKLNLSVAQKAINIIKKYHANVKRKTGEPFYLHPIAATDILLSYSQDPEAIIGTLLHDTMEDTSLTLAEISVMFGPGVASIVNKVSHLDGAFQRLKLDTQENIQQLLEEEDVRVWYVKLADRLHNMRTIQGHPSLLKRVSIANETRAIFIPVARKLGLTAVANELQLLVDRVLQAAQ